MRRPASVRARRRESRPERERRILDATKALFDARGLQEAPVDEIARAVGLDKALIYRLFSSKEELFVLTVGRYLDELAESLGEVDPALPPDERLRAYVERYVDYCFAHPAFLDCSLSLMRRPARELRDAVSEAVWLRLGRGMAACLGLLADALRDGIEAEVVDVDDPDFAANHLYTVVLGTMHLARTRIGVRGAAEAPETFRIDPERVRSACVGDALAAVGLPRRARDVAPG